MNAPLTFPKAAGVEDSGIGLAAVVGAGSMGSAIAAQFANAGVPVILLDIAGSGSSSRNAPALAGIDRQLKSGGFMHPEAAGLIRPGNIEDDIGLLSNADWIVEAVVEDLDVKLDLFGKIASVRKKGSIVSSNTSTIQRAALVKDADADFAAHFLTTHFFNPPRIMQLVEVVGAEENDPALLQRVRTACEVVLGKTVIDCRDTPGFIANRIGCFWMAFAALEAKRIGLTIEEADAVNAALGIPRTGVFGLLDLVGLDLVPHVWGSLMQALPESDEIQAQDLPGDPLIREMIAAGRLGRKSKAGFYRLAADTSREAAGLKTGTYRAERPVSAGSLPRGGRDPAGLLEAEDPLSAYAWSVFSTVLCYAASHAPEIAGDAASIDTAMELGYAWRRGPFRLADAYGVSRIIERLTEEARSVPPLLEAARDSGFYDRDGRALRSSGGRLAPAPSDRDPLAVAKTKGGPIFGNEAASVWDLGDGIACLELRTKMSSLPPPVLDVLQEALDRGGTNYRGLVIGNDSPRAFSVGADLGFFGEAVRRAEWRGIEDYVARGQGLFLRLKYAEFPVVAAAHGFALGGGCEFMLHTAAIVAHAELKAGLPESKVGLVPAWGGCTQSLLRAQTGAGPKGPAATARAAFTRIFSGASSSSAADARANGLLRNDDPIVMSRRRLIAVAKGRAIAMADSGYAAPERASITVAGPSGQHGIMNTIHGERAAGRLTDTDVHLAEVLSAVLCGGPDADPQRPMTEEAVMRLELQALMELIKRPETLARIDHMLKTGKPLRN